MWPCSVHYCFLLSVLWLQNTINAHLIGDLRKSPYESIRYLDTVALNALVKLSGGDEKPWLQNEADPCVIHCPAYSVAWWNCYRVQVRPCLKASEHSETCCPPPPPASFFPFPGAVCLFPQLVMPYLAESFWLKLIFSLFCSLVYSRLGNCSLHCQDVNVWSYC